MLLVHFSLTTATRRYTSTMELERRDSAVEKFLLDGWSEQGRGLCGGGRSRRSVCRIGVGILGLVWRNFWLDGCV